MCVYVHSSQRNNRCILFYFIHVEVEIGFEQAVYSVNEGETVLVCVRLTGPEIIDSSLLAFASISTVPGTATRKGCMNISIASFLIHDNYSFT